MLFKFKMGDNESYMVKWFSITFTLIKTKCLSIKNRKWKFYFFIIKINLKTKEETFYFIMEKEYRNQKSLSYF